MAIALQFVMAKHGLEMKMFSLKDKHDASERPRGYATPDDFQMIFDDDMNALHTLALLLTADPGKAEQCFVAGLEDSIGGNPVFRQWARSWTKRVIIRNAIEMMSPAPGQTNPSPARLDCNGAASEKDILMSVIWELPPFERFVFVVSVLEGHSVSDCASLLGCTPTELTRAQVHALAQVALARNTASPALQSPDPAPPGLTAKLEPA